MVPLMADIRDGFKDIFLAGVGALAYGGERANELVNNLNRKRGAYGRAGQRAQYRAQA